MRTITIIEFVLKAFEIKKVFRPLIKRKELKLCQKMHLVLIDILSLSFLSHSHISFRDSWGFFFKVELNQQVNTFDMIGFLNRCVAQSFANYYQKNITQSFDLKRRYIYLLINAMLYKNKIEMSEKSRLLVLKGRYKDYSVLIEMSPGFQSLEIMVSNTTNQAEAYEVIIDKEYLSKLNTPTVPALFSMLKKSFEILLFQNGSLHVELSQDPNGDKGSFQLLKIKLNKVETSNLLERELKILSQQTKLVKLISSYNKDKIIWTQSIILYEENISKIKKLKDDPDSKEKLELYSKNVELFSNIKQRFEIAEKKDLDIETLQQRLIPLQSFSQELSKKEQQLQEIIKKYQKASITEVQSLLSNLSAKLEDASNAKKELQKLKKQLAHNDDLLKLIDDISKQLDGVNDLGKDEEAVDSQQSKIQTARKDIESKEDQLQKAIQADKKLSIMDELQGLSIQIKSKATNLSNITSSFLESFQGQGSVHRLQDTLKKAQDNLVQYEKRITTFVKIQTIIQDLQSNGYYSQSLKQIKEKLDKLEKVQKKKEEGKDSIKQAAGGKGVLSGILGLFGGGAGGAAGIAGGGGAGGAGDAAAALDSAINTLGQAIEAGQQAAQAEGEEGEGEGESQEAKQAKKKIKQFKQKLKDIQQKAKDLKEKYQQLKKQLEEQQEKNKDKNKQLKQKLEKLKEVVEKLLNYKLKMDQLKQQLTADLQNLPEQIADIRKRYKELSIQLAETVELFRRFSINTITFMQDKLKPKLDKIPGQLQRHEKIRKQLADLDPKVTAVQHISDTLKSLYDLSLSSVSVLNFVIKIDQNDPESSIIMQKAKSLLNAKKQIGSAKVQFDYFEFRYQLVSQKMKELASQNLRLQINSLLQSLAGMEQIIKVTKQQLDFSDQYIINYKQIILNSHLSSEELQKVFPIINQINAKYNYLKEKLMNVSQLKESMDKVSKIYLNLTEDEQVNIKNRLQQIAVLLPMVEQLKGKQSYLEQLLSAVPQLILLAKAKIIVPKLEISKDSIDHLHKEIEILYVYLSPKSTPQQVAKIFDLINQFLEGIQHFKNDFNVVGEASLNAEFIENAFLFLGMDKADTKQQVQQINNITSKIADISQKLHVFQEIIGSYKNKQDQLIMRLKDRLFEIFNNFSLTGQINNISIAIQQSKANLFDKDQLLSQLDRIRQLQRGIALIDQQLQIAQEVRNLNMLLQSRISISQEALFIYKEIEKYEKLDQKLNHIKADLETLVSLDKQVSLNKGLVEFQVSMLNEIKEKMKFINSIQFIPVFKHANLFKIQKESLTRTIVEGFPGDPRYQYNFINKIPIKPNERQKISVRLIKVNQFNFGFASQRHFLDELPFKSPQTIYYTNSGQLIYDGNTSNIDAIAKDNDLLQVLFDLSNNKLVWYLNDKEIATLDNLKILKEKDLYLIFGPSDKIRNIEFIV